MMWYEYNLSTQAQPPPRTTIFECSWQVRKVKSRFSSENGPKGAFNLPTFWYNSNVTTGEDGGNGW